MRTPDFFVNTAPFLAVGGDVIYTTAKAKCGCFYRYKRVYKGLYGMPSETLGPEKMVEFIMCEKCQREVLCEK